MAKGNDFEWVIARTLSLWITNGQDKTQLVRSVLSGGAQNLKTQAARPEYQVGDLAPNGPQGEQFRMTYAVECKNYKSDPDWWGVFNSKNWIVAQWWNKLSRECLPYPSLSPMLVMRRNNKPIVIGLRAMCDLPNTPRIITIYPLRMVIVRLDDFLATPFRPNVDEV